MKIIIAIVVIIALTVGIVWLIDKFVPKKLKSIINIVLWGVIIALAYFNFMSVYEVTKFDKIKVERYKVVINQLVDIRDTELAYKQVNGEYTSSFDSLIKFVETGKVPITQRRDSTILDVEETKRFGGVEAFKTITLIDTLSYFSLKETIFKDSDRYKKMMYVAVGKDGAKFTLKAGKIEDIPVFEASIDKALVLDGEEQYLIDNEKEAFSIAGVKGPSVKIGSMDEINTNGNWGKDLSNKE